MTGNRINSDIRKPVEPKHSCTGFKNTEQIYEGLPDAIWRKKTSHKRERYIYMYRYIHIYIYIYIAYTLIYFLDFDIRQRMASL